MHRSVAPSTLVDGLQKLHEVRWQTTVQSRGASTPETQGIDFHTHAELLHEVVTVVRESDYFSCMSQGVPLLLHDMMSEEATLLDECRVVQTEEEASSDILLPQGEHLLHQTAAQGAGTKAQGYVQSIPVSGLNSCSLCFRAETTRRKPEPRSRRVETAKETWQSHEADPGREEEQKQATNTAIRSRSKEKKRRGQSRKSTCFQQYAWTGCSDHSTMSLCS